MQLGGDLNNGSNCGPFYVNVNNRLGNARLNYGAFGLFLKIIFQWARASLPLGKNIEEEAVSRLTLESCCSKIRDYD